MSLSAESSATNGPDGDWIAFVGKLALHDLEAHLLGDREHAVVTLTPSLTMDAPVFAPEAIREIVGPCVRIYVIRGDYLLGHLQRVFGRKLAPARGAARIWWPGFSTTSDPDAHPLVQRLEGESDLAALEEFARRFDLSRPRVRIEVKLIEDSRALAERERDQAVGRAREVERLLRDARSACREAMARAERAEARVDLS